MERAVVGVLLMNQIFSLCSSSVGNGILKAIVTCWGGVACEILGGLPR